ncbi:reverse transcriptase-like protein [Clostridium sp. YIM B02515]|uniref:Reverse transcriptase-like protein n=1 Tax=Clostridium rhizosphaerae TaxID=2803861 RepID=A0ABS1TF75_9CLOT|nr:reverse transcriptase-like protein [Clostridium rhizosphaerae]MBL4937737.1 reverse transcriptase-like protein [Clostridium rhizosphaerae]
MGTYICNCDASNNEAVGMTLGVQILNVSEAKTIKISECIGPSGGTNYAEGQAVILTLKNLSLLCNEDDEIKIFSDSKDIVDKVNNIIKKKNLKIKKKTNKFIPEYITAIISLMTRFNNISLVWIPRNLNISAHSLTKEPFLDKYTEYRSKKINVKYIGDNLYIAESSKDKNKNYTVNLELGSCTCRFFTCQKWWERKKCKHIMAAEKLSSTINVHYNNTNNY